MDETKLLTAIGSGGVFTFVMYLLYVFVLNHFQNVKATTEKIDSLTKSIDGFREGLVTFNTTLKDFIVSKQENTEKKYDTKLEIIDRNLISAINEVNKSVNNLSMTTQLINQTVLGCDRRRD